MTMLEMNLVKKKRNNIFINYFIEELSNTQFTSYTALSNLSGLSTTGTLINEGSGWLRFDYEGIELIVSKKVIRRSISWNQINNAGCVFGTRIVTINGNQYKVRLLTGADEDPTPINTSGNYLEGTHNSEWSRLFYPIVKNDDYLLPDVRNPDAPYTNLELGMGDTYGSVSWCQETLIENSNNRVRRGNTNNGVTSFGNGIASFSSYLHFGWRPCLERV